MKMSKYTVVYVNSRIGTYHKAYVYAMIIADVPEAFHEKYKYTTDYNIVATMSGHIDVKITNPCNA